MPCLTAFSTIGCSSSGGTPDVPQRLRHVDPDAQALLEARVLDVEVRLDQLELASERGELAFRAQHAAQQRRQAHQRLERAGRRRLNQIADRRQRVEEEVRVDLRAQRPQLGLGRELADLLLAQLALVAFRVSRMASIRRPSSDAIASSAAWSSESSRRPPTRLRDLECVVRRLGDRDVDE